MECHPSIAAFRDFIKMYQQMQIETHLDNTLDSAGQKETEQLSCFEVLDHFVYAQSIHRSKENDCC